MDVLFMSPKKPFEPTDENPFDCQGAAEIDFLHVAEGCPWAPFGRMPPGIDASQWRELVPIYIGYRTHHSSGVEVWPLTVDQAEAMGKALLRAAKLTRKRIQGAE